MATTTLVGHVKRALDFYSNTSLYIGLGKRTQWTDDDKDLGRSPNNDKINDMNPILPTATSTLPEPIGYKRVDTKHLVVPDEEGDISVNGTNWSSVSKSDAYTKGSRWVYIECTIEFNEFSDNTVYRAVGLFSNLVPQEIHKAKSLLFPDQIESQGTLEIIEFAKPTYRAVNQQENLSLIIEF